MMQGFHFFFNERNGKISPVAVPTGFMPVSARCALRQTSYKPWKMEFVMETTDPELQCHVHNVIIAATWHSLSIFHFSQQIKKINMLLIYLLLG